MTRLRSRILARSLVALTFAASVLAVTAFPASPSLAWVTPPPPTLVDVNPTANQGDWLIGATPPGANPAKPVIVFVQGLHGSAPNWWSDTTYYGVNDMYAYAYNNGYRTAFVQFRDADGNAGSMWLNGSVLRQQLEAITKYFGVQKVDIVAHSKGGVDSQSAIVHYGAYPYVSTVFTLSSPHRGSELADLSYSWWSWWLGALLGQHDDGTYVMQTGYMSYFRSLTDSRSEDAAISYRMGGGTNHGPLFSAIWWGGSYLNFYGSNDGVVTVDSAMGLPRGIRLFVADFNHDNIRMGSRSWSYIAPYLTPIGTAAGTAAVLTASAASTRTTASTIKTASTTRVTVADMGSTATAETAGITPGGATSTLLRGGSVDGQTSTAFAVESGVSRLDLTCLVKEAGTQAVLVSPAGERFELAVATDADTAEYFAGARELGASVDEPAAGQWTLEVTAGGTDAYLAWVRYTGGATAGLIDRPSTVYSPGQSVDLTLRVDGGAAGEPDGGPVSGVEVRGLAVATSPARGQAQANPDYGLDSRFELRPVAGTTGDFAGSFRLPGREGVYNLTMDVTGLRADGTRFEKTVVVSVAALRPEHQNAKGLRSLTGER